MRTSSMVGGAVVLLGATVVGGAAYTGSRTQVRLEAGLHQLLTHWPAVKVVEDHYDRSLFSATHTLTLSLGCPLPPANDGGARSDSVPMKGRMLLTIRERIQHGPLPGWANFGAALVETALIGVPASAALVWGSEGQPPVVARTLFGMTGGYSSHIVMAPGQVTAPTGARMEWQTFVADLKASSTDVSGPWSYEFDSPGTRWQITDHDMQMQMQFGALKTRGDVEAGGTLWLRTGKSQGEVASIDLTMQPKPLEASASPGASASAAVGMPTVAVKLAKLNYTTEATRDKADLISASTHMSGQGQVAETKIDKFEMNASVKRLHAPSYEALVDHIMASPCDLSSMAAAPAETIAQIQKDAMQLLPHNPEYSLDKLGVEIGGKRGEISYTFGLEGMTTADTQTPLAALMPKVKASGKARLPREWVTSALGSAAARFGGQGGDAATRAEMTNLMLDQATTNGFVVREGDILSSSFTLVQGHLLVNGKAVGGPPVAP
ncbi:hypothetical protein BH11PSE8_BH11PSE8_22800 [soil metagenome]